MIETIKEALVQDGYLYGAIFLLTISTVLTRSTYHLFGHRLPLSEPVRRALRFAPAAALTGIIVPIVLPWYSSETMATVVDQRLFAGIAAIWIFSKTHNVMLMIVGGMLTFWLLRALLGYW
jgi:branched-subunit amino acid transport protein